MKFQNLVESLDRFSRILPATVKDVSDQAARWKPESGAWSILEIICHLTDEESEDFRPRVKSTLLDPDTRWSPIDPEAAAITRKYNQQDLEEVVSRFVHERNSSVNWLKSLVYPNWDSTYEHPELGPIQAGQLMSSWAAHDLLHLRQITKRMYEMILRDGEPYPTDYAGRWSA